MRNCLPYPDQIKIGDTVILTNVVTLDDEEFKIMAVSGQQVWLQNGSNNPIYQFDGETWVAATKEIDEDNRNGDRITQQSLTLVLATSGDPTESHDVEDEDVEDSED